MNNHENDDCQHLVRASLLEAENARLKAEIVELKNQPDPLTSYLYAAELAKDEVKRLKAEVERLTERLNRHLEINDELDARCTRLRKAGDAMLQFFIYPPYEKGSHKAVLNWNAAKEGKPNA